MMDNYGYLSDIYRREVYDYGPDRGLSESYVDRVCSILEETCSEYIDRGAGRAVFGVSDRWVLKAPLHKRGIQENKKEHRRHRELDLPTAPCRIEAKNLLLMRRVDPIDPTVAKLERWMGGFDGGQVGRLDGEIVAFDYASAIPQDA
jgi:hypothetical protein